MGLQQLEDKFAELIALNDRFGEWEDEFTEKLDAGKLISIKFFELLKKTPIDWNTVWLVNSIATITLDDDNDNAEYVLNKAIDRYVIKSFERKKVGYSLVARDDTPIRIIQLTDFVTSLDEDTKKRLHSMQREGYCHWDSIHLAQNLEVPCKIVSGYCTTQSKKMPYPHTWVEVEHQDTEWVLDFTLNLTMNKDGYYSVYNATMDQYEFYEPDYDGPYTVEGEDCKTVDGKLHLYGIGAYCWIWDEVEETEMEYEMVYLTLDPEELKALGFTEQPDKEDITNAIHDLIDRQRTNRMCRRCGNPVYKSDVDDYPYVCYYCDENMYEFETEVR